MVDMLTGAIGLNRSRLSLFYHQPQKYFMIDTDRRWMAPRIQRENIQRSICPSA
jgi:hypothetical protein